MGQIIWILDIVWISGKKSLGLCPKSEPNRSDFGQLGPNQTFSFQTHLPCSLRPNVWNWNVPKSEPQSSNFGVIRISDVRISAFHCTFQKLLTLVHVWTVQYYTSRVKHILHHTNLEVFKPSSPSVTIQCLGSSYHRYCHKSVYLPPSPPCVMSFVNESIS